MIISVSNLGHENFGGGDTATRTIPENVKGWNSASVVSLALASSHSAELENNTTSGKGTHNLETYIKRYFAN